MLKRAVYGTLTVILVVGALVAALALYILFTRQGDPTVWPIVRLMLTVVLLVTAVALIWVPRTTREIFPRK
jgi:FtsH-binding integral membrane protein